MTWVDKDATGKKSLSITANVVAWFEAILDDITKFADQKHKITITIH